MERTSPDEPLDNAQNLSSSAARSLPRCYSLRILTRFEFGCGSRNRGFSQRRRKSHSSKRVTVAKSASLQNLLRIPYSLPVTRYQLLVTRYSQSLRLRSSLHRCDKSDLRKDPSLESTIHNLPRPNRRIRVGIG